MNLSILEIAQACKGQLVAADGNSESRVTSVVIDSRKVTEGGVFVATVGERVDGHRFIPEVFEKGVSLVVTEKTPEQVASEHGIDTGAWGTYLLVEDSLQALKDIAEYYRGKLSIPFIGITGSVGKTSTKEFIARVLAEKYNVLKTEGNFNNEIGVPLTLLRIRKEHEAAVVEMGISDFGEMHRLSKMVRPDICVITNIGQCHLENLKDRDGVLQAKTEIFDFMAINGAVCLSGEDDKLSTVKEVQGKKTHFFGIGNNTEEASYVTDIVSKGLWGSEACMHIKNGMGEERSFQVEVPLPGIHMVTNAAAAACVANLLDLSDVQIAEGLKKVEAIGGRNHLIRLSDYTLIDDCYNANPVSMKAALDLLAMADNRKVAILGDMFELGENSDAMHAMVGDYAVTSGVERLICVGENAKHMYEAAKKAAAQREAAGEVLYFATREQLIDALSDNREELLPVESTILLKASHGMQFAEVLQFLQEL